MLTYENTRRTPLCAKGSRSRTSPAVPVGGIGRATEIGPYVLCRTLRGHGGWGVHDRAGSLLVSGWPTKARALAYVRRVIGGAR